MVYNIKEFVVRFERFIGGYRMCVGCGVFVVVRVVLCVFKLEDRVVVGVVIGCLEVLSCIYLYIVWKDLFIYSVFENVVVIIVGVEVVYKVLKKKGKVQGEFKFIVFGGDGGIYDIGF